MRGGCALEEWQGVRERRVSEIAHLVHEALQDGRLHAPVDLTLWMGWEKDGSKNGRMSMCQWSALDVFILRVLKIRKCRRMHPTLYSVYEYGRSVYEYGHAVTQAHVLHFLSCVSVLFVC